MQVWFSVTPIGTGSGGVSAEVAAALDAVAATGITHRTDPAGTLLEGSWEDCMAAVRAATEAVLVHAPRASVVCKLDVRTDKPDQTGQDKLDSLTVHRSTAHA